LLSVRGCRFGEPLPGRLGQPLLHQPRHLPTAHWPLATVPAIPATGTGEPCGSYRVQESDAVSAAAYGVGEAGTSDRHVEECLPLEFGGRDVAC
jgi:hypothetical protein